MVVVPHVDRFAWAIGLEEVDVESPVHLFVAAGHIPLMVSDDMVRHPVCRLCLLSDVGRVPLAATEGRKSNTRTF